MARTTGSLDGLRIIEMAGIGPGPFAAMMLADMGADVIRVDRKDQVGVEQNDVLLRNRRSVAVDLKSDVGRSVVLDLVAGADALIEGFRPGVMEKLGIGPEQCIGRNPSLVYGRMTGWGQTGPRARTAGHDISYIAVTGALDGSRRAGELPVPPMNLLGDLGGGSMYLLFGLMCALHHARVSGEGQVVDANIVDGTASLTNFIYGLKAQGMWSDIPGTNVLDTGAPFYDTYRCADGLEIAVGALEPQFYAQLLAICDVHIDDPLLSASVRDDPTTWPTARRRWTEIFASRTRADWIDAFAGSDACVAPILAWADAANDPHLTARGVIQEFQGATQAAPAPRFSATPGNLRTGPVAPGQHTDEVLAELGYDNMRIAAVRSAGAVG